MNTLDTALFEERYQEYLEALLAGNRNRCQRIVEELVKDAVDMRDLYVHVFQRSLYQIGEMWERNQISVAREHMATAITDCLLSLVYPAVLARPHTTRNAVVACTANEYHQLGGKMVADIIQLNGWNAFFLGANTPQDDLISFLHEKKPDLLCLSLSIQAGLTNLLTLLGRIRSIFPSLPIFVGGQAFRLGGMELVETYPGVRYLDSIFALEKLLQEWSTDGL